MSHGDDASDPSDEPSGVEPLPTPPPEGIEMPTPPPEEFEEIDTRLEEIGDGDATSPTSIEAEDFSATTFEYVYSNMPQAHNNIAPDYVQASYDIRQAIGDATRDFLTGLGDLDSDDDMKWTGATRNAVISNIVRSFDELEAAAAGLKVQEYLVEAFENTIETTTNNIMPLGDDYNHAKDVAEFWPEVKDKYDNYAREVMQDYAETINLIAASNPVFTTGEAEYPGQDPGPGGYTPGGGGGGGGGGEFDGPGSFDGPKPFTAPELSDLGGATGPDLTDTTPAVPTSQIANPSGLNNPTDAMRAASDAARNGLGPATDAAKQAADGARKPFDPGLDGPPEGVLGLGPKGLGGSPSVGGAGGKTGAGSRLPRSFADSRPTGAPVTAATTRLPSTAGSVPGAGPGMMGLPGAGAPTGAQRGGDNNNGHQVLKALRRKKNGQEVAGEADAVVPVLGARNKPAKPNADQTDQSDPPGTDVRPVTRAAQRPEQMTQVPNP